MGSWKRYWRHFEPALVLTTLALVLSVMVGHDSVFADVVFKFLSSLEDLGSLENLFHLVLLLINTHLLLAVISLPKWQLSVSFIHRAFTRYALWAYDLMSQGMAMAAGSLVAAYPFFPLLLEKASPISGHVTLALIIFSMSYQLARELPDWDWVKRQTQERRGVVLWLGLLFFSGIDVYLWMRA